jgi:nicotinamidase/pyrazinamidase
VIVVDVQNDFCEGGALAVAGGTAVARAITERLREGEYDHAVATRDWHIDPGPHFSEHPDFVNSWPAHCRADTPGAQLHPDVDVTLLNAVFDKGQHSSGYSGFEGVSDGTTLGDWLHEHDVDTVEVVGIATDHCVRATALDALKEGFTVAVDASAVRGVDPAASEAALEELRALGAVVAGRPEA